MPEGTTTAAESTEEIVDPRVQADVEELAGFEAAFEGKALPVEKTEDVTAEETEQVEHTESAEQVVPPVTPAPTVPAGVTQEQLNELFSTVKTVEELKDGIAKLRDDAFGRLGGIERSMKERVDSGFDWELDANDLKEVEEAVPFLADPLNKVLNRLAKKAKVKIPAQQTINVDEIRDALKKDIETTLQQNSLETYKAIQAAILTDRFQGWEKDVAKPEFGVWLEAENAKQPGLKNMFLASNSAQEIGGVLRNYYAHEKAKAEDAKPKPKPKPTVVHRSQRLAEALPVKGTSSTAQMKREAVTEEDGFELVAADK